MLVELWSGCLKSRVCVIQIMRPNRQAKIILAKEKSLVYNTFAFYWGELGTGRESLSWVLSP